MEKGLIKMPERAELLIHSDLERIKIEKEIELSKRYDIFKVKSENMVPGNNDEKPVQLFRICELSHDEKYPRREAMENVISSMARNNDGEFNFVYFLDGNNDRVSVYLGISKAKETRINVKDFFEILESSFRGNFTGSNVEKLWIVNQEM